MINFLFAPQAETPLVNLLTGNANLIEGGIIDDRINRSILD